MKNKLLVLHIILLAFLCLFTLTQVYYRAAPHLLLLVSMCAVCLKDCLRIKVFFIVSAAILGVLSYIALQGDTLASPYAIFMYYVTWVLAAYFCTSNLERGDIKKLMYFLLILLLIGNVVSIKHLLEHPYIAREMAGAASENRMREYQLMGVGGYGHVYAMVFLTYAIVSWYKVTKSKLEKLFLLIFFVVSSVYIVYSSYTLAIIFVFVLSFLAWFSNMKQGVMVFVFCMGGLCAYAASDILLALGYEAANALDLEHVAKRFHQLMHAQEMESSDSLRRAQLYMKSWETFVANPLTGGKEWGGHSFLLDSLAQYGILGVLFLFFLKLCMGIGNRLAGAGKQTVMYLLFIVFACINTVSSMQIPGAVFFMVPLIMYINREQPLCSKPRY